LILRRDPASSLIETERTTEYRAYQAFHKLGLPVPEPIALELGSDVLERPFFIMAEVENCNTGSIMSPDPFGAHREKVGRQFFTIMAKIAAADPGKVGLSDFERAKDVRGTAMHEVARWEKVIDEDEREPQPIARAALRWLKHNPPPPAQKLSVVHGDYRTGNFLVDDDGNIRAILDWEMSHLGDPLEDLGWAIDPLWSGGNVDFPGGMIARAEAIQIWEEASGLMADPKALHWWEIFASLKGAAIWISAALEYADGRNIDPINAFSGWYCLAFHNRVLADRLAAEFGA
jgi:aminoglycoside phosphotransferase (APT) family kinase protein